MKLYSRVLLVTASFLFVHFNAFGADGDTIKIALTGPYSGGSAALGIASRDGAKLAINKINAQGGIDLAGKKMKIEIIERDDEGKNERGALVAQELSGMKDIVAVVGTVNTGVAIAGDKYYQDAKKVKIISPAAGTASMTQWTKIPKGELYIFRFAANDGLQAAAVVDEAVNKKGFKKVAIIHDSTNYGASGKDDLLKNLKKYPEVEVVAIEKFNIGDKTMKSQLTKMNEKGAEAVLIWGIGPELAAVANDKKALKLNAPIIGGWTLTMSSYLDNAGKNADGTLTPQNFIEDISIPFVKEYHKAYGVKLIPSAMSAAQGHDAILVLAAALQQAGTTDSTKLKEALESIHKPVVGVIKTYVNPYSTWDPTKIETHEAFTAKDIVMAVVKDGKIESAYNRDVKKDQKQAPKSAN